MTFDEEYTGLRDSMGLGSSLAPADNVLNSGLDNTLDDIYAPTVSKKEQKLASMLDAKSRKLRKDEEDYGDDSWLTQQAKGLWNSAVDHGNQMAVNIDGKRYNTENKIFNDETDLTDVWGQHENIASGDKSLYYLRKQDGVDEEGNAKYLYKTGIADVSAADRYKSQLANSEWDLIAEKRFDEASTVEKEIHGSQGARDARAFDYGTYKYSDRDAGAAELEGRAFSEFGAGTSELYNTDILGLDTGTQEEYDANKLRSIAARDASYGNYTGKNDTFEFVDAFQSGVQKLAGKGVSLVGAAGTRMFDSDMTGDGAIESYGKKLVRDADKDWGYNPKTMNNAAAGMKAAAREGRWLDFVGNMALAAPQAVAGSAPEMALFMGTGGGWLYGRVGALALANANDELDAREENNDGEQATWSERAAVMAAETFATSLDAGVFRFVTMGANKALGIASPKGATKPFKEFIDEATPSLKLNLISRLGKTVKPAGVIAGDIAAEGIQETTTEAIRMLAESLGTTKFEGKDWLEVLESAEGQNRLSTAAVLGMAGGMGFSAVGSTAKVAQTAREEQQKKAESARVSEAVAGTENTQVAQDNIDLAQADVAEAEEVYNALDTEKQAILEETTEKGLVGALIANKASKEVVDEVVASIAKNGVEKTKDSLVANIDSKLNKIGVEAKYKTQAVNELEAGILDESIPSEVVEKTKEEAEIEVELEAKTEVSVDSEIDFDKIDAEAETKYIEIDTEIAKLDAEIDSIAATTPITGDAANAGSKIQSIEKLETKIEALEKVKKEVVTAESTKAEIVKKEVEVKELKELDTLLERSEIGVDSSITQAEYSNLEAEATKIKEKIEILKANVGKTKKSVFISELRNLKSAEQTNKDKLDNAVVSIGKSDRVRIEELQTKHAEAISAREKVAAAKVESVEKLTQAKTRESVDSLSKIEVAEETKKKGFVDRVLSKIDGHRNKVGKKTDTVSKGVTEQLGERIGKMSSKAIKYLSEEGVVETIANELGIEPASIRELINEREATFTKSKKFFRSGVDMFGGGTPNVEAVKGVLFSTVAQAAADKKSGKIEPVDQAKAITSGVNELFDLVRAMSRTDFNKFVKEYHEEDTLKGMLTDLQLDKVTDFSQKLESLMANRQKSENTDVAKKRYIREVARSKGVFYAEDIALAKEYANSLYEGQAALPKLISKLDAVEASSKEAIADVKKQAEAEVESAAETAEAKLMADETLSEATKVQIGAMSSAVKAQLFSEVGLSADSLKNANIYNIKLIGDSEVEITFEDENGCN